MRKYFMFLPCLVLLYASVFGVAVLADDSRTVRVGLYENSPKIFINDKGNASGFWPEILEYIALEEGWEIEYLHGTWTQCLDMLEENEIDMMPDVAYTEERASLYDFSNETVYTSWSRVYAREGSDIQSILDLKGKNVAVLEGSVNVEGPEGIKILTSAFDLNCIFTEVGSYLRVFELVENGEADAGVVSKDFANQHQADFNIVRTAIIFQPAPLHFAFPKGASLTPYLTERIDYQIDNLKADENSIYYKSLEKWFGVIPIEKAIIPGWIIWLLASIGGLALFFAGGSFILRSQVRSRTKELIGEITERRQSEGRYSNLVEQSNDGIIVIQDGLVKFANLKILEITGFSMEAALGKPFIDFVAPEYRGLVANRYKRRMSGEEIPSRYEIEIAAKDGRNIPVEIGASVIEHDGEPADMAVVRNITERKQAEEKLLDSEARYRRLFETAQDAILILDGDTGEIIDANPFIKDLLGNTLEELLGKSLWEIGELKDVLASKLSYKELHGEGYVRYDHLPLVAKDGRIIAVEVVANAYMVDHQRIIQCNIRDITERKQAEEKSIRSAQEWRTTFNSITDLVSIHDKDHRIVRVNKAFSDTFNKTPDELAGKFCYELVHGTDGPPAYCPLALTLETGKPNTIEEFEPNLGIWIQASCSPIFDEEGKVTSIVHIARNISEQKKILGQVMAQDRLASIGQLVSGVAHEINNPLTSIIGFSEFVLERDIPDDIKNDLKIIHDEAARTAVIVKSLLTFAREQPDGKALIDINENIQKVLKLRDHEQKTNSVQVITHFASDLPYIMGNSSQLQQVVFNIVLNAEYFMLEAHHKGTLSITTERIGDFVRASFTDDGPGISKKHMSDMFSPFVTTKEVGKGTGLGLSVCHGIITEHGGRIYAESEPGKGATFVVELPIPAGEDESNENS